MFYLFPFFLGVEGDGLQKINDRINGLVEGISVVCVSIQYDITSGRDRLDESNRYYFTRE